MARRIIIPDEPLPMEIPDSPRWPLSRTVTARDAAAQWLSDRARHIRDEYTRSSYRAHVRLIQRNPRQKNIAQAARTLRERRDWRGYAGLQRLILLSRWATQLKSPPPQISSLLPES